MDLLGEESLWKARSAPSLGLVILGSGLRFNAFGVIERLLCFANSLADHLFVLVIIHFEAMKLARDGYETCEIASEIVRQATRRRDLTPALELIRK